MKPILLSLLACILFVTAAHAHDCCWEECCPSTPATATAPAQVADAAPRYVAVRVELWELHPIVAKGLGFERTTDVDATDDSIRFEVLFGTNRDDLGDRLTELAAQQSAKVVYSAEYAIESGHTGSVVRRVPFRESLETDDSVGYTFLLTPTLDDKGRITLALDADVMAPASAGMSSPEGRVFAQKLKTTMRINQGQTIVAANLIPLAARTALASVTRPGTDQSQFPTSNPAVGWVSYLLLTPTVIVDR